MATPQLSPGVLVREVDLTVEELIMYLITLVPFADHLKLDLSKK